MGPVRADDVEPAGGDDALQQLAVPPGSKYSYSNPGFIFLGRIIEGSRRRLRGVRTKNILMPLGCIAPSSTARRTICWRPIAQLPADDAGGARGRASTSTPVSRSERRAERAAGRHGAVSRVPLGEPTPRRTSTPFSTRASLEEMWTRMIKATGGEGGMAWTPTPGCPSSSNVTARSS